MMNTMHMMKRSVVLTIALFGATGVWADYHLSLKSSTVVSATGGLSATLYGSGSFKLYTESTCTTVAAAPVPTFGIYYVKMDTAIWWVDTPLLRYSDGEFYPNNSPNNPPPLQTFPVQDFTAQIPACLNVIVGAGSTNINLNGLKLTYPTGAQVALATNSNYSFSGGDKFAVHAGKYKTRLSATSIPEPGTLALLLAGVGGLALSLRRNRNRAEAA